jgi:hypothetical protein
VHAARRDLISEQEVSMPQKDTIERAKEDRREGKSASTQAGEFVREEIEHIREGKHGARSTRQAIAIGLSKARRAGVRLKPPGRGQASATTRERAERDYERGRTRARKRKSPRRARATSRALKREGRGAASRQSLARQAKRAASRRGRQRRRAAARKAARTRARRSS